MFNHINPTQLVKLENVASAAGGIDSSTITISNFHVIGQQRILVVSVLNNQTQTATSVRWGGRELTFVRRERLGATTAEIWYLLNPKAGIDDVQVTLGAVINESVAAALCFSYVDPVSPVLSDGGNAGSTSPRTISHTTKIGKVLIVGGIAVTINVPSAVAPSISQYSLSTGELNAAGSIASNIDAGLFNQQWTFTAEDSASNGLVLAPVYTNTRFRNIMLRKVWFDTSGPPPTAAKSRGYIIV